MSNRFKTVQIEDTKAENIDRQLQEQLIELFAYAVRSIAPTLIREAGFHTDDFATACQRNCAGFELRVTRQVENGMTFWYGTFTRENQRLEVLGTQE
ncbi:MAG TPA: hypothetical protein EYP90_07140 [Chromatiaceae bacterium]|nr:hypothetical protein [Chromatiaceae bacterium]